jgi:hypothetical protein
MGKEWLEAAANGENVVLVRDEDYKSGTSGEAQRLRKMAKRLGLSVRIRQFQSVEELNERLPEGVHLPEMYKDREALVVVPREDEEELDEEAYAA